MSELIVAGFDDPHTAFLACAALARVQEELQIDGRGVALVSRDKTGEISVREAIDLNPAESTRKAFWKTLAALLLSPGSKIDEDNDAMERLGAIGIGEPFTAKLENTFKPNTSALFMLIDETARDRVIGLLRGFRGKIARTRLIGEDSEGWLDRLSGGKAAHSGNAQETS